MRTLKLTVAYDGTNYAGWQIQPNRPTVQAELETAIQSVTGQAARVVGSGRTDAGVHALGQVAAFRTQSKLAADVLLRALNACLPEDVAVLRVDEAADGFHPIRDSVSKRYRYVIHDGPVRPIFERRYCWQYRRPLDAEAMSRAVRTLLGKHDFSSFESTGAERLTSVRTIFDASVERDTGQGGATGVDSGAGQGGQTIHVEVRADGFLYNMVRAIVGTLVEVGRGARGESWVGQVLEARDRSQAGPNAPPEGLFLIRVEYD